MSERHAAIVIGAGQAGLSTSYYLRLRQIDHVVLDAEGRVGDAWRHRWDSLRLFTPAAWNGLPGLSYLAASGYYPTKDEMADYLQSYAARFELPVRGGVTVERLEREGERYLVTAGGRRYEADHVVVATGAHGRPYVPAFADELDPSIVQLHSSAYRSPRQLPDGPALVVGAGTSGVEIAIEAARAGRPTTLSGQSPRQVPRIARVGNGRLFWWFASRILTLDTPIGRRASQGVRSGASPLIHTGVADVVRAGIERVPRTTGVHDGRPAVADGRTLEVASVIWCTGFRHDFSWIALPLFDERGEPRHDRGVVMTEPGLYFVGLPFLYSLTSALVGGVGRDADHIVTRICGDQSGTSRNGGHRHWYRRRPPNRDRSEELISAQRAGAVANV